MTFVRTLSFRRAIIAIAALVASVGSAKADITIDDFNVPGSAEQFFLGGSVPDTYTRVDGNRTLTVTQTQNTSGFAFSTNGSIGGGSFVLNTNTGTTAHASLAYSYASGLDLSSGGTILKFAFTSTDLGVPFSVIVGDGTATATQVGSVASASALSFDLSGFSGINLAAVTSIELVLNGDVTTGASTPSADFSISSVSITTPPPPTNDVPAPPAAFLALAALPVLGLRKKLMKKA